MSRVSSKKLIKKGVLIYSTRKGVIIPKKKNESR